MAEWVTLKDAATMAGVSTKTLRRRIKDGTLPAQRDTNDPQAPWMVREDTVIALWPQGDQHRIVPSPPKPAGIELAALLESQRDMLHELQRAYQAEAQATAKADTYRERVTDLRSEVEKLRSELDQARTRRWWRRR